MNKNHLCYINNLHDYLAALKELRKVLIIMAIRDTPGLSWDNDLQKRFSYLGLKTVLVKRLMAGYVAVIDSESVFFESEAVVNKKQECAFTALGYRLSVKSHPFSDGNFASIIINDEELAVNKRGLNIVVLDLESNQPIDSVCFDTHIKTYDCTRSVFFKPYYIKNDAELKDINNKLTSLGNNNKVVKYTSDLKFWFLISHFYDGDIQKAKEAFFKSLEPQSEDKRVIQTALSAMLKEVKRVCDENDIEYWLMWGTLLGAVRHGGSVPWDDDVDIAMMRKDIGRFSRALEASDSLLMLSDFWYIGLDVCHIVRVVFKDEKIKTFVDVFIYDYVDDEDTDSAWESYRKKRLAFRNDMMKFEESAVKNPFYNFWEEKAVRNEHSLEILEAEVKRKNEEMNVIESEGAAVIWGIDNYTFPGKKVGIYKSNEIYPLKKLMYDGVEYNVPNDYMAILNRTYGDIYTLPDDILGHNHVKTSDKVIREMKEIIERMK